MLCPLSKQPTVGAYILFTMFRNRCLYDATMYTLNKSSSSDEIHERDVTYIILSVYLLMLIDR